ncbi:MAG: toprim domain-containing protein, partial [Ruminococcus sp.]|nr:toprim domain-containing protein [Ruminococcus sp.]
RGNVIAFGGRIMTDQKPKYLNTSDTVVFNKSVNLFSLNNAKNSKSRSFILCEGYMDVISLNQAGFSEAIATLGTALTFDQATLLKRYCDEVIICYDADEAGQKATARAIDILRRAGIVVRVLSIPDGKDPDEFIRRHGDKGHAAFKNLLESSGNDVDYRMFKLKASFDMTSTQGKLGYLNECVKILAELDNPMERDIYASKLADDTEVAKPSIMEQINRLVRRRRSTRRKEEFKKIQQDLSGRDNKINPQYRDNIRAATAEENLISFLVGNPDKLSLIEKRLTSDDFITEFNRKLYIYFSQRIKNGQDPMTAVSADFTADEASQIYRIVNSYSEIQSTPQAMDEYIRIILDENTKLSMKDIANASTDNLAAYLKKLAEQKK